MSIAECLDKKHYQSSSLSVLNRSLTEKVALVKRNLTERQKVVHSALEFHSNYDKVITRVILIIVYITSIF